MGIPNRTLIVAEDARLRFALAGSDGSTSLTGRFPEDAPVADELVIADFGLLGRAELFAFAPGHRIGLLLDSVADVQPGTAASAASVGVLATGSTTDTDFARLARRWAVTPTPQRAFLSHSDRADFEPLLGLRRDAQREARRALEQLLAHLRTRFPRYAELLAPTGALRSDALAVLRKYPLPSYLLEEGPIRLRGVLERSLSLGRVPGVAEFMDYRAAGGERELTSAGAEYSARLVLGALERAEMYAQQAEQLDRGIQRLALGESSGGASSGPAGRAIGVEEPASVLSLPAYLPHEGAATMTATPSALPELFERLARLRERGAGEHRHAPSDFEAFALLRTEIDESIAAGARPTSAQLLASEVAGQTFALHANDYAEAARFLASARRLLSETPAEDLTPQERIDAELVSAITGLVTTDVPTGFGRLRQTLQDGEIEEATPALRSQALGLKLLILVLYGETPENESVITLARTLAKQPGMEGAARAGQDVAELMVAGADPATEDERLAEMIDQANRHSRDTYFRPFYNHIMMTVAAVTRDLDAGVQNYAELRRSGVWEKHNPPLFAQARLSRVLHLTAAGDFSAARREIAEIRVPAPEEGGGAFMLRRAVFELYLSAAVGDWERIREATEPEAPLGEHTLRGLHAVRYLPATLVMRGSALVRDGAATLGGPLFRQATATAAKFDAWAMLLCGESREYREWLTALSVEDLPEGLTPDARDRIVSRPLFFAHELPELTGQQARVLRLLALGRSTGAIASDLHITANTLKTHLRRLYARLGVSNRREAVHLAEAYGFLD